MSIGKLSSPEINQFTQHMPYCTTAPAAERSRQQARGIRIGWKEMESVGQQQKSRQISLGQEEPSLLLPIQHSPSGWLTGPTEKLGSSCLGMAQVPLEGKETQRKSEKAPSLQGQPALGGLDSDRHILEDPFFNTQFGSPSFPGQHLGFVLKGKRRVNPHPSLSHMLFHRPLIISSEVLPFPRKGDTALFLPSFFQTEGRAAQVQ